MVPSLTQPQRPARNPAILLLALIMQCKSICPLVAGSLFREDLQNLKKLQIFGAVYFNVPPCVLVVRVLGYRSGGPSSIPGTTRKKTVMGLERGPFSLVSTTEELLDRKVAAPV
jgi:hypothetical protein